MSKSKSKKRNPLHNIGRQAVVAVALIPVFVLIHFLGHWLRYDGDLTPQRWRYFFSMVVGIVLAKVVVFAWFRVYQGWTRYVTFHDLLVIAKATTVSTLIFVAGGFMFLQDVIQPRSVILMDWALTILVVGGLRAFSRAVREGGLPLFATDGVPVFIVGANDAGEALLRTIRGSGKLHYQVEGFIDDAHAPMQFSIGGVPVVGALEQTADLAVKHGVQEVLITSGELSGKQVRSLVEQGGEYGFEVTVLPSYGQLLGRQVLVQPRQVTIEDILQREQVEIDMESVHQWLDDRCVLVTGSAGSIGSEITRQLLRLSRPSKLVLLDRWENGQFFLQQELARFDTGVEIELVLADLTDEPRIREIFSLHQPDVVFHAAAYKHVPLMEDHPREALKNIFLASKVVADLSLEYGVHSFVMISTDKAVNPCNVMGACKRAAELYMQVMSRESATQFVSVRFGNVLDSTGSVVPIFRDQIARGGPVTVTDPRMTRYFMTIPEASQLVIQAGCLGKSGEIYLLDMGEPVKIIDLARDMIRLSGLREGDDIEIEIVGLRPGEKLFESLYTDRENFQETAHPKIYVVNAEAIDAERLRTAVESAVQASDGNPAEIREILSLLVPEYSTLDQQVLSVAEVES